MLELSACFIAQQNIVKIWVILWFKNELYEDVLIQRCWIVAFISVMLLRSNDVRI